MVVGTAAGLISPWRSTANESDSRPRSGTSKNAGSARYALRSANEKREASRNQWSWSIRSIGLSDSSSRMLSASPTVEPPGGRRAHARRRGSRGTRSAWALRSGARVVAQVAHRHQPGSPRVVRVRRERRVLDRLDERVGDRAAVEALDAEVADALVRARQVGIALDRPHVVRRVGGVVGVEVELLRGRDVVEPVDVALHLVVERLVDLESLARDVDAPLQHALERPACRTGAARGPSRRPSRGRRPRARCSGRR